MKNDILVIVAHPDDEILWVWGTILKHIENGDSVNVLILSNWEDSRWIETADNSKRRRQSEKVKESFWLTNLYLEDLPDNKFDTIDLLSITKIIEKYIIDIKPSIIYTHHSNDLNIDHRMTFQAVLTASRPQPLFPVKKILTFETLSSTEWQNKSSENIFKPNYYINIEKYINKKIDLIKIYKNELKVYPHPRSIEWIKILSNFRWIEIWCKNAEAFEIVRILD